MATAEATKGITWTSISEGSAISKSIIEELTSNIKKVAANLDSKTGTQTVQNKLPINSQSFNKYTRISLAGRDSIYDSVDILQDNISCVTDKSGHRGTVYSSCNKYVSASNSSHLSSNNTSNNSSPHYASNDSSDDGTFYARNN